MAPAAIHHLLILSNLLIGSFGFVRAREPPLPPVPGLLTAAVDLREIAEPVHRASYMRWEARTQRGAHRRNQKRFETAAQSRLIGDETEGEALHFDDIDQSESIGNISLYQNTHFAGFKLLNISAAYHDGKIDPEDIDCAASAPNALLGRREPGAAWPRFYLADLPNAYSNSDSNPTSPPSTTPLLNPPLFNLDSLTIKPLGYVPLHTALIFNFWNITNSTATGMKSGIIMYLREGHQVNYRIPFKRAFWMRVARRFNVFEVYGVVVKPDGTMGEDVPFCVDDLEFTRV